jgi:hypothetical protein
MKLDISRRVELTSWHSRFHVLSIGWLGLLAARMLGSVGWRIAGRGSKDA